MSIAYICDAIRTPIGRYGGTLSSVRADDLAAAPIKALMERNPTVDWKEVDDIFYGCANQAGEDNRNVARMAGLLAGLPVEVPGMTINRLCASSLDAVGTASRAIKSGEVDLVIAGGVESMSRAPFVMGKAETAFSRSAKIEDTTIGWRFVNPKMKAQYGIDSMPETAENVAVDFNISRADQDAFALRSQERAARAIAAGVFKEEIVPVTIPQRKGDPIVFDTDEHPRSTTLETLAKLKGVVRPDGSVTAGNASGVNDGACAVLLASEAAVKKYGLTPKARVVAMATAGLEPRIMGFGPAPAVKKVLAKAGLTIDDMDLIELNEAFASQVLATLAAWEDETFCKERLGLDKALGSIDRSKLNVNGSSLAAGHPFAATGGRILATAAKLLDQKGSGRALISICAAGGQGVTCILEK